MEPIIYSRIVQLCKEKGISLWKLQCDLGFSDSTIASWRKGTKPSAEKALMVAQYFSVSSDYLLGVTDIPVSVNDFVKDDAIITIQRLRNKLSSKDKDKMMQMLQVQFAEDFPKEDVDDL